MDSGAEALALRVQDCIQIRTPLACTTCASDDETQYLDKDSTRVVRTRRALFVKEIRREKLPYAAVVSVRIRSALVVITNIIFKKVSMLKVKLLHV